MKQIKSISFVIVYTLLFTALIFTGKQIFFSGDISGEEKYIEPSLGDDYLDLDDRGYYSFSGTTQQTKSQLHSLIYESFREKYTKVQQEKISFRYIPSLLKQEIQNSYLPLAEVFFYKKDILSHIENLGIYMYQNKKDTRGRMRSRNIHIFGVLEMSDEEFLSVLIHEFGHYFDIYSLPKSNFGDISQKFYDISWDSISVMTPDSEEMNFVSGYAMTNQYEDFAESYVYYILHNRDFLEKAENDTLLARKYSFFENYVFPQKQFYKQNFSTEEKKQDYYWDITKLGVDVKNFLQYVQKDL